MLTGKPDAGKPPVRFGGRGGGYPLSLPLSWRAKVERGLRTAPPAVCNSCSQALHVAFLEQPNPSGIAAVKPKVGQPQGPKAEFHPGKIEIDPPAGRAR